MSGWNLCSKLRRRRCIELLLNTNYLVRFDHRIHNLWNLTGSGIGGVLPHLIDERVMVLILL